MQIAESNEPITSNVKRIIDDKGIKQVAVARKANFSPNDFSRMMRGRKLIKPRDVNAIASALGVPINELYKEVEE